MRGDACLKSANPADVVFPHMAVGGNPLRVSSPTVRFAPNNRRRQRGSARCLQLGWACACALTFALLQPPKISIV